MAAAAVEGQQLVPARRDLPRPARGEVLVRVHAAGVNRPDVLQRKGLYPPPPGITDIPGLEIAGEVVALGAGVTQLAAGDRVCALVAGGGYAEYATVPAAQCLPLPKGLSMVQAASLPETFFTVWRNLQDIGKLRRGESVLIHGGSSGIGTAAIQMATARGATVITTAGTAAKCRACLALGAVAAINYKKRDFVSEVAKLTQGRGVDLVLDMVGGDYMPRNLQCLAPKGRHVSIATQAGRTAEIDIFRIMSRQLTLSGSTLRAQPVAVKGRIARQLRRHIWPLVAKKKIAPVIDRVYPLQKAQAAHDRMESGRHIGKIVLKIL